MIKHCSMPKCGKVMRFFRNNLGFITYMCDECDRLR